MRISRWPARWPTQGQNRMEPLKVGDKVYVADTINVSAKAKLRLQMVDGSILSIASGTRFTIADYSVDTGGKRNNAKISLSQGLMRAVVETVDRPSNFEINTAVGTAAV